MKSGDGGGRSVNRGSISVSRRQAEALKILIPVMLRGGDTRVVARQLRQDLGSLAHLIHNCLESMDRRGAESLSQEEPSAD